MILEFLFQPHVHLKVGSSALDQYLDFAHAYSERHTMLIPPLSSFSQKPSKTCFINFMTFRFANLLYHNPFHFYSFNTARRVAALTGQNDSFFVFDWKIGRPADFISPRILQLVPCNLYLCTENRKPSTENAFYPLHLLSKNVKKTVPVTVEVILIFVPVFSYKKIKRKETY